MPKLSILCRSLMFVLLLYYALPSYASPVILVLGDSLSASYGLNPKDGWVQLLADKIKAADLDFQVINASVTGATSGDGLNQFPQLLESHTPSILILALGSNDGLRGNAISLMRNNLTKIIEQAQAKDIKVLLIGFKIPLNYGSKYSTAFAEVFPELSKQFKLPLVPFLLEGFALDTKYFQDDRLHPTVAAQPIMLNNVWEHLRPML